MCPFDRAHRKRLERLNNSSLLSLLPRRRLARIQELPNGQYRTCEITLIATQPECSYIFFFQLALTYQESYTQDYNTRLPQKA